MSTMSPTAAVRLRALLVAVVGASAPTIISAAVEASVAAPAGLDVSCNVTVCQIAIDGTVLSSTPTASLHADGRWCHSADGTLEPNGPPRPLAGADRLGEYTGTVLPWKCGSVVFETSIRTYHVAEGVAVIFGQSFPQGAERTALGPAIPHDPASSSALDFDSMLSSSSTASTGCALEPETDFHGGDFARISAASPEACCALCQREPRCAVFTWYTGRGHTGPTAHCNLKATFVQKLTNQTNHTAGSCRSPRPGPSPGPPAATPAQQLVLSAFPRLAPPATPGTLYATVYNQMVGGMADGTRYGAWDAAAVAAARGVPGGTMAGPMMLWADGARNGVGSFAMVLTPITHAMEMNIAWNPAAGALEAGLLGSVAAIPVNYTSETMLFFGNRSRESCAPRACGLNSAVAAWGVALRRYKGKDTGFPAGGFEADPTLEYLGY